jgi:predicted GIY-YIG superfamily endonuclease
MTKKDLIDQLALNGVKIEIDLPLETLQALLASLPKQAKEPKGKEKKKKKKAAKKQKIKKEIKALAAELNAPLPSQKNKSILQELRAEKNFNAVVDQLKKKQKKDEGKYGKYIVSFTLVLDLKNHGYTTRLVTEEFHAKGESKKEILEQLTNEYISNTYHDSEVEVVETKTPTFTLKADVELRDIKNKQVKKLQYKMFPEDLRINKNEGQCVLDTIMAAMQKSYTRFSREQLITELTEVASESEKDFVKEGISTNHLMKWVEMKKHVSCYALDPFLRVFHSVTSKSATKCVISFIVNSNHVFPVTGGSDCKSISKTGKLDLTQSAHQLGMEDSAYSNEATALNKTEKVVHVETDDLSALLKQVVETTGYHPTGIVCNGSLITLFEHPETKQVFIASQDYNERKLVCDKLLEETNYIKFLWANQSWAFLFQAWQEFSVGVLPQSSYSKDALMIHKEYPISAYIAQTREVTEEEKKMIQSFDRRQDYASSLMDNPYEYAIDSVFDEIEPLGPNDPIVPGKAYVNTNFSLGEQHYQIGFWPSFLVQYAIDEGLLKRENVTHIIRASRKLAADTFKDLTKKLMDKFPELAKRIINSGIGAWGRRFKKEGSVAITDSFEVALGMLVKDKDIKLTEVGNSFWFLRKEKKELLFHGHVGLREHIVCLGRIKLHQMEKLVCNKNTEVIAYNTDSIKVLNSSYKAKSKAEAMPGEIYLEPKINLRGGTVVPRQPYTYYKNWTNIEKIEAQMNRSSMLVEGQPGCGKSTLLKQMYEEDLKEELKSLKVCWTKTAAINIEGQTLDHEFPRTQSMEKNIQKALTYDVISIDENTIIPERYWSLFLQIKMRKPSMIFRIFGGSNQLHSVDYNSKLWYDYHSSGLMNFLVDGKRLSLEYLVATARYDVDMKQRLDVFGETNMLSFGDKQLFTPDECNFSIVKTAKKRKEVNEMWMNRYSQNKKIITYNKMKFWEGMYLISHSNEGVIINSTRYKVKEMGEKITLIQENSSKELLVSYAQASKACQYGYADTVMRVISRTITGKFNIYETDSMEWNEMFVALSRATTASNIGMEYNIKQLYKLAKPPAKGELLKSKKNLVTGIIYKRTDDEFTYIGSTTDFDKRKREHEQKPVSTKVADWEKKGTNIRMEIVESYICMEETEDLEDEPVKSVKQLVEREYQLIARVPADKCMNTNGLMKTAAAKTETKVEAIEVDYSRFKITDDINGKRFRIRWRDVNGDVKTKECSYKVKSKAEAEEDAKKKRAELIKQYFI